MAFAIFFLIAVISVYIILCLVAGALCGSSNFKKDVIYYSVSSKASYERLIKHLEHYPENACKIVCINNLEVDELKEALLEQAKKFGFKVI